MSLSESLVGGLLEVDTRRADQLADHDALGAVDDEGAARAHQREVAHEDRLALDLAGLVVGELGGDVERRGVGEVLLLALLDGVLGVVEHRVLEGEAHRLGEVLDRGDLLEDLLETGLAGDVLAVGLAGRDLGLPRLVADQPVEAVGLEGEELGDFESFFDLRERDALRRGRDDFRRWYARPRGVLQTNRSGDAPTHHWISHRAGDQHMRAGAKRDRTAETVRTTNTTRPARPNVDTMMNPGGPKVKHLRPSRWTSVDQSVPLSGGRPAQDPSLLVCSASTSHCPPTLTMVIVTWLL